MAQDAATKSKAKSNAVVFGGVAFVWLVLDYLTKQAANTAQVGDLLWSGIPGFIDFRLVHNTGAAWGMFGDSTFALGVFAIVFCAILLVIAHVRREHAGTLEMVGYGLVLAGGIGNAIDRFTNSYVVDFIETTFIQFPVFNVADIGVTCGFALIVISYFLLEGNDKDSEDR
ncbi:MAG: signal peptidase II [Coriobacteriia bacterium]|nr:signal peptidase II [Coriobacteriia bacterium]